MSRYETIVECDCLVEVNKFNPYHDARGRFSTADAATSFTYAPGKSKAHDMAIARAKEQHKTSVAAQKESIATAKTKKGEFDIYMNVNGKKFRRTVNGRIDSENGIGYAKNNSGYWNATDIKSGLAITTGTKTLKGMQQAAADIWEKIVQVKNSNRYSAIVDDFKNAPHE